ncbi:ABC transporter permease [Sulfitobacter donghicola]|uniref:ABC transporter permease n=1 Tax=Sulfitobacter donghicola DSW-25 = KCTC 12864 = JCM 14565 TaxID=1300350 RepID=A0A073IHU7_9RHOB|nr:ABC transporter permease [Sulfitobacter donghicola]KEJ89120.1 ABC transporter permease [Sulfitobacter donghicola DSW-25 = KCTC 12864 = JCM 14565]KIN67303.1 ABC transporter, permease protein [Sulfitobacter donghicola DSW-25 = KCTC 12864 = JCM 14565]
MMYILIALIIWAAGWLLNVRLANGALSDLPAVKIAIPAIFGLTIVIVWELLVRGFEVNPVILPAPSSVISRLAVEGPILWADFQQTILKGAVSGYLIGTIAALVVAVIADRSEFLTRGILPVGSFMAALPIVGTAPIFVKWLGSDWESKAAVVAVMVFFPILVNTVAGLKDTSAIQRDLMRTYASGYWSTLFKLRLPSAMPFIFNGLKIGTTLALIGAIVAEFFGSPTVGMGFRISTSFGQLALDMVWAEIVVAALAGSAFYGAMTWIEKRVTFWHPSQR